jgi:ribosomal protein L12E/L44/L45/RPP1/RPP2
MTYHWVCNEYNTTAATEQTTQWPEEEEQTTQWPEEEEQTTQWPEEEEQDYLLGIFKLFLLKISLNHNY